MTRSNEDAVSRTAGVPQSDENPSQGPIPPPGASEAANLRIQRAAAAQATIRAQSLATGFRIGDIVTTSTPRSPRYHQRTGRVITTNLGEVGVSFSKTEATDAWFLPAELVKGADGLTPRQRLGVVNEALEASIARHQVPA